MLKACMVVFIIQLILRFGIYGVYFYYSGQYVWGDGQVVRRCWVNFQCRGVLLIWMVVGQGPIALAVGVGMGGGCWDIFLLPIFFLSLLWETARYRLKYCLKGPLNPKQPTNQSVCLLRGVIIK